LHIGHVFGGHLSYARKAISEGYVARFSSANIFGFVAANHVRGVGHKRSLPRARDNLMNKNKDPTIFSQKLIKRNVSKTISGIDEMFEGSHVVVLLYWGSRIDRERRHAV
jgi:hypothetical protein